MVVIGMFVTSDNDFKLQTDFIIWFYFKGKKPDSLYKDTRRNKKLQ